MAKPALFVGNNREKAMLMCNPAATHRYENVSAEWVGDTCFVRFRSSSLEDSWIEQVGQELDHLIEVEGCRRMVISLEGVDCLYSLLLGKLLTVRRSMLDHQGRLRLCDVPSLVREVFRISKLEKLFEFAPDRETALHGF